MFEFKSLMVQEDAKGMIRAESMKICLKSGSHLMEQQRQEACSYAVIVQN